MGDLVQQSMVQGRRLRRQRRLAQFGAGGSALAMLLVIGLAAGPLGVGANDTAEPGGLTGGSPEMPVGTTTPSPVQSSEGPPGAEGANDNQQADPLRAGLPTASTRVIGTVRIGAEPGGKLLTTTPEGALELLTRLLPGGKTSGYASLRSGEAAGLGMPYVELHLDRGAGPGMLRLAIYQGGLGGGPAPGTVELTEVPDDCVQNKMVTVHHPSGIQVTLMISTCLVWEGKGTSPARPVLSVDEAIEVAASPIWGTKLPAEFVVTGTKRFSTLARSNG
ncbi:hypothetical protein AB0C06_20645 [Micromonospora inaquosa]|uniref:Uncharacterized protein n=1 Tax=Micromonospora inaquosa TaxID=2203716 RepID=A0A3N9W0E2_9ACTN|nr:hypothetical protein [Micromonospora inaquosa]RQW94078.1 hypothetical protein DLJ59_34980 [Micromonospora inaquosa]